MNPRLRALSVVVAILIATLAGGFIYEERQRPPRSAREAVLKKDLSAMRSAIDNYTIDKQRAPQSIQDLVTAHYLREVPVDPITRHRDWVAHFGDSIIESDRTVTGIDEVHSASRVTALNGTPYSTW